jgi:RNA polymerase-binding transcription factor DksA
MRLARLRSWGLGSLIPVFFVARAPDAVEQSSALNLLSLWPSPMEEVAVQRIQLERYRSRLLGERSQLVAEMDRIRESIVEEVRPPGEHEIAPSEGIDTDVSLATGAGTRLRNIDAALDRIKEGVFGNCLKCGRRIAEARLDAVPEAMYCIDCEQYPGIERKELP